MSFSNLSRENNETIGYTLEDVRAKNQNDLRHFLIPSQEEINGLKVGDQVRLFFVLDRDLGNGCRAERMWVEITQIGDGVFKGILTNQPAFITSIQIADELEFLPYHIASVLLPKPNFDESLGALITDDCLERREINWAVRAESNNEKDSGWQFLTGYDGEDDLDDSSKINIISFEEALNIEPLLEPVLDKDGEAYFYQEESNFFVEDK